jgi:hypothetical protein
MIQMIEDKIEFVTIHCHQRKPDAILKYQSLVAMLSKNSVHIEQFHS